MSDPKPQLTRNDLKDMTPAEILQAKKDGQLQILGLGGHQVDIAAFRQMTPDARQQAYEQGLMNVLFGINNSKGGK